MANNQREFEIYRQIARFMFAEHPNTVYRFDFASGMRMTPGLAKKHKSINPRRGYPDLFIAEPKGKWSGLFIEIKAEGESPLKKDGTFKSDEHVREQHQMLCELQEKGYKAVFGVGLEQCREIINGYLGKEEVMF